MTAESSPVGIRFTSVGWRTSVQDLGRVATERLGVPRGGAADQGSARVASILVGNDPSLPLIESLGGAVAFTPSRDVLVAVAGAVGAVEIDGCRVRGSGPFVVPAGAELRAVCSEDAARIYVAVAGVMRCDRLLGSAAPDVRMGFTQAISVGDVLTLDVLDDASGLGALRHPHLGSVLFDLPVPRMLPGAPSEAWTVRIVDGDETATVPGIRELLSSSSYLVDARSDHVGIRLEGPVLHPAHGREIVSHGVPIGAIEVPHSDELIVLGRYRTLTAGYPVVGFVTSADLDLVAQARPGRTLRFSWTTRAEAAARAAEREAGIRRLAEAAAASRAALGIPGHTATRRTAAA